MLEHPAATQVNAKAIIVITMDNRRDMNDLKLMYEPNRKRIIATIVG